MTSVLTRLRAAVAAQERVRHILCVDAVREIEQLQDANFMLLKELHDQRRWLEGLLKGAGLNEAHMRHDGACSAIAKAQEICQ